MSHPDDEIGKLHKLLDISRDMSATTDLDELLGRMVDATCEVLHCERATIFLYDASSEELYSRVGTGLTSLRFPADRGIAGEAATRRETINVPDVYADPRFNRDVDRKTGFVTRNLLTFPLENLEGELMGVLQALNKVGGAFTPEDESLARVLSAQAGVALHRHALLEEYAEKQRMARDLEIARRIQQALFPRGQPHVAGYEIAGWNRCADETGGDCYDFMPMDDGRLAIMLADATGHGIGAALVIAQYRSLTRGMLSVTSSLPTVAERVNGALCRDLSDDCFVTAFLGVLDPARHELAYVSAGQGPLLFISSAGVEARSATGLPLAILDRFECESEAFTFAPGDVLVLLTDGFYEAANPAGEPYGEERVMAYVQRHGGRSPEALIDGLQTEIMQFTEGCAQADDLTAVLVRREV
jgi:phosphoserine phosphatase